MPKTIVVGMIEFEDFNRIEQLPDRGTASQLNQALTAAKSMIDAHNVGDSFQIFVAPEYYFGAQAKALSLTRESKKAIREQIAQIAQLEQFYNVLLIPGTIPYRKETAPNQEVHHNVATVYYQGKVIARHFKQRNDRLQSEKHFRAKTEGKKHLDQYVSHFRVEGIKIGIDICKDHYKKTLLTKVGPSGVDIHILLSEGLTPFTDRIAARVGGLVVYCNSLTTRPTVRTLDRSYYPLQENGLYQVTANAEMKLNDLNYEAHGLVNRVSIDGEGKPVVSIYKQTLVDNA